MLQPRYNVNLWSKHLRVAFTNLPTNRSRKSLAKAASDIAFCEIEYLVTSPC